ncbi:MAG: pantetheine-phosphate adenylyltransferase [Planctomycetota bacterium]|nr:pantetheine-phosphate adenylyltransferase [Planctomycetota bacterium]
MPETSTVICPGVFDPVTLGHLDVIGRGAALFDRLVVAVHADPPGKACLFTAEERADLVRQAAAGIDGVSVTIYDGLTVALVRRQGASFILRGLRQHGDFTREYQMAVTNRTVAGVETVFLAAEARTAAISSRLVREVAALGGDVSAFVPECVAEALASKLAEG